MSPNPIPESSEYTNPDISSSDSKIIEGIIADLRIVIDQPDMNFANAKRLILELARRLDETKRCEQSQICRTIKEILQDKIKDGKITEKWIEECLPQEYKRRYAKSEASSLSKKAKRNAAKKHGKNNDIIVAHTHAQSAKSVLTSIEGQDDNGTFDDRNLYNGNEIEQGPNKEIANQNNTFEDCDVLRSENYELKQAVKRLTSIVTADKISATEIEFRIPKAKYEEVESAMESSRDSISVTFDKSGIVQRAEPDIFRGQNGR